MLIGGSQSKCVANWRLPVRKPERFPVQNCCTRSVNRSPEPLRRLGAPDRGAVRAGSSSCGPDVKHCLPRFALCCQAVQAVRAFVAMGGPGRDLENRKVLPGVADRRKEDGGLMAFVELALIFIYTFTLVIKSCDLSSLGARAYGNSAELVKAFCSAYGFGEDGTGVYLFFLVLGLGMIAVLLLIALVRFWTEGNYVPKIFLLTRTHSVSPSMIVWR
eukprot:6570200-Prymnesium_polylepis.1